MALTSFNDIYNQQVGGGAVDPTADISGGAYNLGTINVNGGADPTNAGFTYDQNGNLVDTSGGLPSNTPTTLDLSGNGSGGGGSNSNGMGILSNLTSGLGKILGITDPQAQGYLLPALAMAIQQFKQSGQYRQYAQQEARVADPFGPYRDQAAQRLMALEKDPSLIAKTPGYQFALNQTLQNVGSKESLGGYGGTDTERNALSAEAQGLASKTYNDTIAQLSNQAGTQFGPDAAAQLLAQGNTASMLAQSNALGALMYPFGTQSRNVITNNTTGTNGGSQQPGGGTGGMGNLNSILNNLGNSNQNQFNPNYSGPATDPFGNSTPTGTDNFTSYDNNGNALDSSGNPFGMGGGE